MLISFVFSTQLSKFLEDRRLRVYIFKVLRLTVLKENIGTS
jgi:hypothetical protein